MITSDELLACQGATTAGTGTGTGTGTYRGATSVEIVNHSAWAIHYFYLSPVTDDTWGADQLGAGQVITTGGNFDVEGVPCGNYDVKLVDEDGDECVMNAVDICQGSREWVISSEALLACQAR